MKLSGLLHIMVYGCTPYVGLAQKKVTAEAITTIETRKTSMNHWVLYSLLIIIIELELFSDSQALGCQYLVLYGSLLE